jgi:hypothetical protein
VRSLALAAAAALVLCPAAPAAFAVATNAQRPALRVDARGNAEVSWTAAGARHTLLVPKRGRSLPGGKLSGADVSRAGAAAIPFRKVVRAAGGWLYGLQAWQVTPGCPLELRFSRWRGAATAVTLTATPKFSTELLEGTARFAGAAASGYAVTPEGKRIRVTAYVDCFCGGRWTRIGGVAVHADGSFRLLVKAGSVAPRYRAVVTGPTRGDLVAPDGLAVAVSSL